MPIIPKRRRSLAGSGRAAAHSRSGSRSTVLVARDAPATPALIPRNLRREMSVFFISPPWGVALLVQLLDRDFLEEHDVFVAVILQADVAFQGSRAAMGFKIELSLRYRIAFGKVGDFDAVQHDHCVWAVQGDLHGVPLRPWFPRFGQGLCQRIQCAGD